MGKFSFPPLCNLPREKGYYPEDDGEDGGRHQLVTILFICVAIATGGNAVTANKKISLVICNLFSVEKNKNERQPKLLY